ncbi:MAG: M57 family metalloprotease [Candidatus Micrarchaeota archaeon]
MQTPRFSNREIIKLYKSPAVLVAIVLLLAAIIVVGFWFFNSSRVLEEYNQRLSVFNDDSNKLNALFSSYNSITGKNTSAVNAKLNASYTYLDAIKRNNEQLGALAGFVSNEASVLSQRGISPEFTLAMLENTRAANEINANTVQLDLTALSALATKCNVLVSDFNLRKSNYQLAWLTWNSVKLSCDSLNTNSQPACYYNNQTLLASVKKATLNASDFVNTYAVDLISCNVDVAKQKQQFANDLNSIAIIENQLPTVRLNQVIHIGVEPLPSWSDSQLSNVMQDAFSYWASNANVSFAVDDNAAIRLEWLKEFGSLALGHVVNTNFVQIALGDSKCIGEWQAYDYDSVKHIVTHELGHVIGFDHSTDPNNIMYSSVDTKYIYDYKKTQVIAPRYVLFIPVCTSRDSSQYSFSVSSDRQLNVSIIPSESESQSFVNRGNFAVVSGCSASLSSQFSTQCTVPKGAGLMLINPSSSASATATVTIKEN